MGAGGRVGREAWTAAGAATGTCWTSWGILSSNSSLGTNKLLPEEQQGAVEQPAGEQHEGPASQPEDHDDGEKISFALTSGWKPLALMVVC